MMYIYCIFLFFTLTIYPYLKKYLKRFELASALTNQYMQKKVFQLTSYTTKGDGFSLCIPVKNKVRYCIIKYQIVLWSTTQYHGVLFTAMK